MNIEVNGKKIVVNHILRDKKSVSFSIGDECYYFEVDPVMMSLRGHGVNLPFFVLDEQVFVGEMEAQVKYLDEIRSSSTQLSANSLVSPMPGKIFKVLVTEGQTVKAGEPLLIMEAMKMEHTIKAHKEGTVSQLKYKEGDQVTGGVLLVEIEEASV
jgi:biotin carboxyl carrier protein